MKNKAKRLVVIDTVSPSELGKEFPYPEDIFRPSSNGETPFAKLEKLIRNGYNKPVDEFDFHLHYNKGCTGHTDVPAEAFDTLVQSGFLFPGPKNGEPESENREYYVCFIPKGNPSVQLPATPISEQSGASHVSDVAVQSTEHEHPLENTEGTGAGLYFRRAATAPAPAQLSVSRHGIPTSLPIQPRSKRPSEGGPNVQEENKRPRVTAEASVGLSNDHPVVPKIEPIQEGLSGSRDNPIVIPEPEPADPHQRAYNFFLAHKLSHAARFEVGIINPVKVPDTWKLDKEGRLNKVSVHIHKTGRSLVFLIMDRDQDNAHLERPLFGRISMNVVNFLPAIKHLQRKEHLISFLRMYTPALRRGDPFEKASIVDLGSDESSDDDHDEDDHQSNRPSNEDHRRVATIPKASKIVTLYIEPDKFAILINQIYRSGCTNCKKDENTCQPLQWGAYLGCMRCKELGLICNLSVIHGDSGTSLPRKAKLKHHRSYREMQSDTEEVAAAEPGTVTDARLSETPSSESDYEERDNSDQIRASSRVERQGPSQVSNGPPIPGWAQSVPVSVKITFEDRIEIHDSSRPLNFGPCHIKAFDTWTASAFVDRVLRGEIKNKTLNTPRDKLGSQHEDDLCDADLTVWLVLGSGLRPPRKLLFRSFDHDEPSSSSEKGWLEKAVEKGWLKVHDECTAELNVEMHSKDSWRGMISSVKRYW